MKQHLLSTAYYGLALVVVSRGRHGAHKAVDHHADYMGMKFADLSDGFETAITWTLERGDERLVLAYSDIDTPDGPGATYCLTHTIGDEVENFAEWSVMLLRRELASYAVAAE
jgi:nucleotide-binding universal stress UspA family protein